MNRRSTTAAHGLAVVASTLLLLALAGDAVAQRGAQPLDRAAGAFSADKLESGFTEAAIYSRTGPGTDFLAVGLSTRGGVYAPGTEPLLMFVPPVPDGAWLVQVFLSWNWMLNGEPPVSDTISVNGQPVMGGLVGVGRPDLCWAKAGVASYLATFDGALNPLVAGINLFTQVFDKPLGGDPLALGEGLSVLYVYEYPTGSPVPWRGVDVFAGYTSNTSREDETATVMLEFSNVHWYGDLHILLNALDGQLKSNNLYIDDLYLGGVHLLSGVMPGTYLPSDAWVGFFGPKASTNMYDHADGNLAALGLLTPGTRQVTFSTRGPVAVGGADCIGHSLAAASFPTIEPFVEWSPGLAGTGGSTPALYGEGHNIAGGPLNALVLASDLAGKPAQLVVGFWALNGVFKGGILGPYPNVIVNLFTDQAGGIVIPFQVPSFAPPFSNVWFQYWMKDAGGPAGYAASNTLIMTTQ